MRLFAYPFRFRRAPEGGWVVTCRDLPEAISQAATHEDRLAIASGCLQAALEARMRYAMGIPRPSTPRIGEIVVAAPVETAAKAALHEAMRAAKVSRSELARRLGVDEKEVRRMLDPGYGSKLPRIASAIEAVGQRMVVGVEPDREPAHKSAFAEISRR
jgi:antitoxin HicB